MKGETIDRGQCGGKAFQEAVVDVLASHTAQAMQEHTFIHCSLPAAFRQTPASARALNSFAPTLATRFIIRRSRCALTTLR